MTTPHRSLLAGALALVLVLAGCSGDDLTSSTKSAADRDDGSAVATTATTGSSTAPSTAGSTDGSTDGADGDWEFANPEDEGVDPAGLEAARAYAFAPGKDTQGVVVLRHGKLVAEWYADGAGPESWAASWSVGKSVASALIGIAIDDGKIPGVDVKMTTYYPDWADRGLAGVTLRDVLEMSTGLAWEESYSPADLETSNVIDMVVRESDQLAYAAGRPAEFEPGTVFEYSSGTSMLLSGVIEQATGMTAGEYAEQELWGPLGVEQVDMWSDAAGHTLTYCCLDTTTRNFARFGQLYLEDGRWGDEQVVPESWVAESVAGSRAAPDDYGYQWWLGGAVGVPDDMYSARGHDGQYIYVIPSLDLVAVRNGIYVKDEGPPVAEPTLFEHYPSGGLVPGRGTTPPDSWDDGAFLGPIVAGISD